MDSATTLVHAFVSSRVDYCNILLAGAPKVVTDRLQRVMNAAARVVGLQYSQVRPMFVAAPALRAPLARCAGKSSVKLGVAMYSCLHGQSPRYLADLCVPVWTSQKGSIFDPLLGVTSWLSTLGPRAFSGPARRFGTIYQTA